MELPGTKRTHHPAGHWITSSRRWCALGDGREIILSHAGCALSVILADRDQQESMPVDFEILDRNTGGHSNAGSLATIIDIKRIYQLQTGVGRNPGVQSIMGPPFSHRNACTAVPHIPEAPTI